jgi:hypothetical protein
VPPLTRWYIRLALSYFIAALLLGLLIAVQRPLGLPDALGAAGPAQVHLLVVGWITQMIFGVAYWMFPKASAERPRGNDALAIVTFVLLNVGLITRLIAEPWHAIAPTPFLAALLIGSATTQWLSAVGFVAATWPRVRGR